MSNVEQIMEQAQVFASAWSLVGGIFDNGNMLTEAEEAKSELRKMIEALAQPAQEAELDQEPIGYMNAGHVYELQQKRIHYGYVYPKEGTGAEIAVYTTPQKSQPLTDEQIMDIQGKYVGGPTPSFPLDTSDWLQFARAIEAAHNIKGVTE